MEILIVLGCIVIVTLGYLLQRLVNKIKNGDSVLAKKLSIQTKVVITIILVLFGIGIITYTETVNPEANKIFIRGLAPLIALIVVSLFVKDGLSLIGINFKGKESPQITLEKSPTNKNTSYFKQRRIIIIIIVSLIVLIFLADLVKKNPVPKINNQKTEQIEKPLTEEIDKTKTILDPTINVAPDNKINATTVPVGTFYDGKNGFSLSIPSGNQSTCIWTYSAGSAQVPYSITTDAKTATEKHTISVYGDEDNLKVTCVDDFGNNYIGSFPE
jgi:hypothetical protein